MHVNWTIAGVEVVPRQSMSPFVYQREEHRSRMRARNENLEPLWSLMGFHHSPLIGDCGLVDDKHNDGMRWWTGLPEIPNRFAEATIEFLG